MEQTHRVKSLARELGFAAVGIAPAGPVPHAESCLEWIRRGLHADMSYMPRNVPLRLEPAKLVPGAKCVICLAWPLLPADEQEPGIARYARGRDYHKVLKQKCIALMDEMRLVAPNFEGRAFVDSAPVMERSLAAAAGLGWIGRNGCLIVPGTGSHVLLCEIICNLPLASDTPIEGSCGQCGRCVESCPTGAILPGGLVDARRCVSYLTIEHEGAIEPELWPRMGAHLFGCDVCQEVCPHNISSAAAPPADRLVAELLAVLGWNEGDWDAATRGRALRRVSWPMFLRNAVIAAGNSGRGELVKTLHKLQKETSACGEILKPIVDWALSRLSEERKKVTGETPVERMGKMSMPRP